MAGMSERVWLLKHGPQSGDGGHGHAGGEPIGSLDAGSRHAPPWMAVMWRVTAAWSQNTTQPRITLLVTGLCHAMADRDTPKS